MGLCLGCFNTKEQSVKNIRADVAKNNPGVTITSLQYVGEETDASGTKTLKYSVAEVATHAGKQYSGTVIYSMDAKTAAVLSRKMESMQ